MNEKEEEKTIYEIEDCDNGIVIFDPKYLGKELALYGNSSTNKNTDIQQLIGKWLWEDIQDFMNEKTNSHIKINITFEEL